MIELSGEELDRMETDDRRERLEALKDENPAQWEREVLACADIAASRHRRRLQKSEDTQHATQ